MEILTTISAIGDLAITAVAIALWRMDRRIYKLEILNEKEVKNV